MAETRPILSRAALTRLSAVAVASYAALLVLFAATAEEGMDLNGIPWGFDFLVFWSAAEMAEAGRLAAAFDPQVLWAELRKTAPDVPYGYYWLYPPTFAVLVAPLALLPYGAAFWIWTGAGLALYAAAARAIARDRTAVLCAFGATSVYITAYHGQNAFLTAALAGLACLFFLERKDLKAGALVGLLAMKPHLAVFFPLALAAAGRWRAFGAAAVSTILFAGVAVIAMGPDYLAAFWAARGNYADLHDIESLHASMTTLYGAARLAGLASGAAFALHAAGSIGLAGLVLYWFRRAGVRAETLGLLLAASLLGSPYVMSHDLVWLGPAALFLAAPRFQHAGEALKPADMTPAEQWALVAAALLPAAAVPLGRVGLQVGWLAPACVIWIAHRRLAARYGAPALLRSARRAVRPS